jgi:hypothetical protein
MISAVVAIIIYTKFINGEEGMNNFGLGFALLKVPDTNVFLVAGFYINKCL